MIEPMLELVEAGQDLSVEQMSETIGIIMDGQSTEDQVARLLVSLHSKGESVEEVAGAALALRQKMTPIHTTRTGVIDVVGTGSDASGTFNISTAAALVTAAAGVPVAKHGNRAMTSRSGSADVLAELGVNIEAKVPVVEACLEELGICFCFAPLLHQAMKHVAPIRQKLGTPTIFNILGPLANPAGATRQLLGVARPELQPLMAKALALLGTERALVVHGDDGLDEVTLTGVTHVIEVVEANQRQFDWNPEDFGLQKVDLDGLRVDGPEQSAQRIRTVLQGRPGPATDIVVANAAAAIWTAGLNNSVGQCAVLASEAIQSGAAADLLAKLVEKTNAG
ncbi:MAG: anthranilate phosphoribosyltransferase [Pirellulales bacterium]|nr:anthranilate phosphoribosyltransferase [Pirellulales bacterium]